jgi:hypothetical protein
MKKYVVFVLILLCLSLTVSSYSSKLEEKLFYNQGFFGAAFLYQTYFTIGMASDTWSNGTYKAENSRTIIQTCVDFLALSEKTLKELSQFSITSDDRNTLLQMIDIATDLKNQGSFMLSYMNSKNESDLEQYELSRKQAWEKISRLMDLK